MTDIVANFHQLKSRISTTLQACNKGPDTVTLVAVSKTHSHDQIATLFAAGQHAFGENYVDEALQKISALKHLDIIWHFIGTVQSKKAQKIAQNFSWVHTVCRFKEAALLSEHRPAELGPLNICLQVKMDDDPHRNGVPSEQIMGLIKELKPLPRLKVRGLMLLPPFVEDSEQQRTYFSDLRTLFNHCNQQGAALDTLSMGMSHDFENAILEGATMLRIGTEIFGLRRT